MSQRRYNINRDIYVGEPSDINGWLLKEELFMNLAYNVQRIT